MSAKKKRLLKLENKTIKLDKLELKDLVCTICQSILIEPITLPCNHFFCQRCFKGSVENNALCCPLCRLRIGSWLRTATKQKNLVNVELWDHMKSKFSKEINDKLRGEDVILTEDKPIPPRLSAPGEIRSEYEAELKRLKSERLQQERKHMQETERLIKKIQEEEQEAQRKYLERLKEDELLAQKLIQKEQPLKNTTRKAVKVNTVKTLKPTRIDAFLSRGQFSTISTVLPPLKDSPLITDDSTSSDSSKVTVRCNSTASPEVVPSYGKIVKNIIDPKVKPCSNFWNKENGDKEKKTVEKPEEPQPLQKEAETVPESFKEKTKGVIKSLLVSLPLPQSGILQHKTNVAQNKNSELSKNLDKRNVEKHKTLESKNMDKSKPETCRNFETGSVDSMRLELCYFKPIEKTSTTGRKTNKSVPIRVPGVRADLGAAPPPSRTAPSRAQYIAGLCQLRHLSLSKNLPSAFVIALNILKAKQGSATRTESLRMTVKQPVPCNTPALKTPPKKKPQKSRPSAHANGTKKVNLETDLRRTRSMGSIAKDENETTPKKAKIQERKVVSEKKPRLRSDTKKLDNKILRNSPLISKSINKVDLAVKNLSSPLKNCDLKKIVEEQLRIEQLIQQEKNDMELARKMDAELNGRRQLRKPPTKRQVSLSYALRPPKKVKV